MNIMPVSTRLATRLPRSRSLSSNADSVDNGPSVIFSPIGARRERSLKLAVTQARAIVSKA